VIVKKFGIGTEVKNESYEGSKDPWIKIINYELLTHNNKPETTNQ
jgi:hypothetical protein